MLHPTILIFSHKEDEHLHSVLRNLGADCIPLVVDLRDFCHGLVGSLFLGSETQAVLRLPSGEAVPLDRVQAVWWRRPTQIEVPAQCEERFRTFVRAEQQQFFDGLYSLLSDDVRFYNHPDAHRRMDRKAYQLRLARECQMRVPQTCITSDAEIAKNFLSTHPRSIYKSFWGTQEFWQPTRLVTPSVLDALESLCLSPVIFQEYIEGVKDIRVTVIDSSLTAVAFDISKSRYQWDVRIDTKIPCSKVTLPLWLQEKLFDFCKRSLLRYAAIDLRETADGDYCFFEVNPAGQFLYLDLLAGTRLARMMADALRGEAASDAAPHIAMNSQFYDVQADAAQLIKPSAPLNSVGNSVSHLI
ncbi:UNVERIFIED_ORG: glutathione synthase/RimK-type ligase-like ATP-grasp enzyme [Variovorax paradoxus]|nr:glutathione synthase/RimK-type ligase-like ATP-grasp enzyme [Variovorax paradoxus]